MGRRVRLDNDWIDGLDIGNRRSGVVQISMVAVTPKGVPEMLAVMAIAMMPGARPLMVLSMVTVFIFRVMPEMRIWVGLGPQGV